MKKYYLAPEVEIVEVEVEVGFEGSTETTDPVIPSNPDPVGWD